MQWETATPVGFIYEKDHIEKTLLGLEVVYLMSPPVMMGYGTHVTITHTLWIVEVRHCRMRGLPNPKMKFLKLMPQSDGTKVCHAKKRQIPPRLVAV